MSATGQALLLVGCVVAGARLHDRPGARGRPDEGRAFAVAHSAAKKAEGKES